MEHDWELFIARLEILEIGVCNILQNPGNIGKRIFLIQSYPGNIGNLIFPNFPYPGNIGNIIVSEFFFDFFKKRRAPKFHAECTGPWAEISHMRPIQARKLKLFQTPISRWRTATTRQQLSHLARPLDHHAQGPNVPFGVNPSLRYIILYTSSYN